MIFKLGSRGETVKDIQKTLTQRGHCLGEIDGIFGNATRRAVTAFQLESEIKADGIVGPSTWKLLFAKIAPHQPELRVPESRQDLYDIFGDPLEDGHWKSYGGFCITPPELDHIFPYAWQGQRGFWCNKPLIPIFQKIYGPIADEGLASKLYSFDGCHNVRYIRGGTELSMHSWGIAVDHNAKTNRIGIEGDMDPDVVKIFENEEFTWGGRFKRKDPMHFEFTKEGL